eukprot:SAG31_NODE_6685_length_1925_cov_0.863636_1_plen_257_part_00
MWSAGENFDSLGPVFCALPQLCSPKNWVVAAAAAAARAWSGALWLGSERPACLPAVLLATLDRLLPAPLPVAARQLRSLHVLTAAWYAWAVADNGAACAAPWCAISGASCPDRWAGGRVTEATIVSAVRRAPMPRERKDSGAMENPIHADSESEAESETMPGAHERAASMGSVASPRAQDSGEHIAVDDSDAERANRNVDARSSTGPNETRRSRRQELEGVQASCMIVHPSAPSRFMWKTLMLVTMVYVFFELPHR